METTKSKADASLRSWTEMARMETTKSKADASLRSWTEAAPKEGEIKARKNEVQNAAMERELEKVERARDSEDSRLATELSALRASDTQPSGTAAALKQPQVGLRAGA